MYERMLNKQEVPAAADMASYCGETALLFTQLNEWLSESFATEQKITFPYGNQYGWGIAHRKKKNLICNIFAEKNAFTVMLRLSNAQFALEYDNVKNMQKIISIINILAMMAAGYIIVLHAKSIWMI